MIKMETIEEVSKFHVDYAKRTIKGQGYFSSMMVAKKGKLITPIVIPIDREKKKFILEFLKSQTPDWLVYMDEMYFREIRNEKINPDGFLAQYQHGDMERSFKIGDEEVKEGMIVHTYMNGQSLFVSFEVIKKDGEIVGFGEERKTTEAKGYLM
jgi:hypothetical protein